MFESLLTLLVIIPILLYCGYQIFFQNKVDLTIVTLVIIFTFYILIHHFLDLFNTLKKYGTKENKINRNTGLLFILIGLALLIYNIYILLK
jgi:hypothetical protein